VVPSIAVIPFVSVAGEDSSLQLYHAVSKGEQVLSGLAFSLLVQPVCPRLTGCILMDLANSLKPDCRYTYHLLCHLKKISTFSNIKYLCAYYDAHNKHKLFP